MDPHHAVTFLWLCFACVVVQFINADVMSDRDSGRQDDTFLHQKQFSWTGLHPLPGAGESLSLCVQLYHYTVPPGAIHVANVILF